MDEIVKAALKKWPNVPACRDWLGLDARGDWYMRDDRIQAAGPFPQVKGSRLLHEKLREHLGSPFCAAIPNRDILLCFRNDEETVDRLREQIEADHRRMPHGVTEKLLLVTADGIAPRD